MDAPYSSQRNSFHLARFILATMVILCHSFTLLGRRTPLSGLTGGLMNEGTLAVDGLMTISGFLICQSAVRSRGAIGFLRKRVVRILPALLCALAFSAMIIGGLAYEGSFAGYVRLRQDGPFTWMLNWLTLNVQPEQWGIAGVFSGNPTTSLNVSLWTIKFEVFLYLLMAALMVTTLHRKRPTYIVLYAAFLLLRALLVCFEVRLWDAEDTRLWVLSHWNYDRLTQTGLFFFTGTILYAYRDHLARRWYLAVIAAMALVASCFFSDVPSRIAQAAGTPAELLWRLAEIPLRTVYWLAVPYLVIYLATSPVCAGFARLGDLSLGLYLFSYPIGQMIIHVWPQVQPMALFALTMAFALPVAAACWRWVEVPCGRLKGE